MPRSPECASGGLPQPSSHTARLRPRLRRWRRLRGLLRARFRTTSPANHEYLRSLGAEPVAYGAGLAGRVRAVAPGGVDVALDVAGSGVLPELIELAAARSTS
jgi:hypothetical protein